MARPSTERPVPRKVPRKGATDETRADPPREEPADDSDDSEDTESVDPEEVDDPPLPTERGGRTAADDAGTPAGIAAADALASGEVIRTMAGEAVNADRRTQTRIAATLEVEQRKIQEKKDLMTRVLRLIGFSPEAAGAMVNEQLLINQETVELDDEQVENLCRTVRKPGGGTEGHQIAEMARTRLQLLVFYVKHLDRVDRLRFTNLEYLDIGMLNAFKDQKRLEREWHKTNPEHKHEAMQLDPQRAATAFDQAVTMLRNIRGVTGVPLAYVVRHNLIPKHHADDPACGKVGSVYSTYDEELEARAPIAYEHDYYRTDPIEEIEKTGPFHPAFLSDTRKVWSVLHALWSKSGAWTYVKTMDKTQNGRQVYRTLHKYFFGANKVANISTKILTDLRGLSYTGDTKNFNFDKYVTEHVKLHNQAVSLLEYGGGTIDERHKIEYFVSGIKCTDFEAAKASLHANTDRFTEFDTVKDHFLEFRRMQHASRPPGTIRNVSSVGGRGGRGRGAGRGQGEGRDRPKTGSTDARKAGLPSQAEIDRCTHIQARRYPPDEYKKFTPAERQKHWQLMNPGKTPATDSKRKVSFMKSTTNTDESNDDADLFPDSDDDKKPSSNRDNAALTRKKQK